MNIKHNQTVSLSDLVMVARFNHKVELSDENQNKIISSRKAVEKIVESNEIRYGINTGFGAFKNKVINKDQTEVLQRNLILSHAVGVGDLLSTEVVRGIMFVMVNYLSKGYSGIKLETLKTLVKMLNKGVHPLVPEKGSVGSSGDLAPSAHVALVLIGEGKAEYKGKIMTGFEAMKSAGIAPINLSFKEGLAIINNTSAMTSISALLLYDSQWLVKIATITASLSLQALSGTDSAYDMRIHELKAHVGQIKIATLLNKLLKGSGFVDNTRTQEAYSFRCVPQVHGAIDSMLEYATKTVTVELNSVTDNPLIFTDVDGKSDVVSGGNFHGEPVAIAMDSAGIALCELGDISERRTASLLDPATNNGLPPFLIEEGGVNSGLMITQYTSAALVSENKILSHPASVDSIPTSANIEDIVSMGTIAARKSRMIFENVTSVLATEIISACQAIDLRKKKLGKNIKLSSETDKIYKFVRTKVPFFTKDVEYRKYIEDIKLLLEEIASIV